MRYCRVVGPLWAAAKHPAYAGRALFVVQPIDEHGANVGTTFVAIDHAQAGAGDKVIVLTEGNGVRQILGQPLTAQVPIRSMIVGIVDEIDAPAGTP